MPGTASDAGKTAEAELAAIDRLVADNPVQQANVASLKGLFEQRAVLENTGATSAVAEDRVLQESSVLESMQREEERLLASRNLISRDNYRWLQMMQGAALVFVLGTLGFVFSTLLAQLALRAKAETAVRRLSARILGAQDAERRRLARELHDGLGQLFAGIKMETEVLRRDQQIESRANVHEAISNCQRMAEQGLSETRTISYLLHPPMLDELGFQHAVRWYVEGFSNRSKIEVKAKFSEPFERLPRLIELVLFRVIQEALANIHRHSGSTTAEISIAESPEVVRIAIRDFGKGIPEELLKNIEETSVGAGVGLGGMRERVSEFDGRLSLESGTGGTTVHVSIPLPLREEAAANGDPKAQAKSAVNPMLNRGVDDTDPGGLAMAATI
jgi:signal transduction histidine kinase